MEANRTAGRSNAKDCAHEVIVMRWLLEALAQLQFAAASLGGSDRPPCERWATFRFMSWVLCQLQAVLRRLAVACLAWDFGLRGAR